MMDELHDKLELEWFNVDFVRDCKHDNNKDGNTEDNNISLSETFKKDLILAFDIKQKNPKWETYNDIYRQLMKCYKSLWGSCFKNVRRNRVINGQKKQLSFHMVNDNIKIVDYLYTNKNRKVEKVKLDFNVNQFRRRRNNN
jgi:hypothetical protein